MNRPPHRGHGEAHSGGFSLLELCVAIALIAVLAGVLLNSLLSYQELAEKTAVDLTLLNMRSGVRLQIADRMIHAGRGAGARWVARPLGRRTRVSGFSMLNEAIDRGEQPALRHHRELDFFLENPPQLVAGEQIGRVHHADPAVSRPAGPFPA